MAQTKLTTAARKKGQRHNGFLKEYLEGGARRCFFGITLALTLGVSRSALANPHGMTVTQGAATATSSGSQLTVTASQNAFLNWQSFNIASGETTTFQQPSASSVVWNRINDVNPSQIWGNLNANGMVVLMNQSGFFFGPNCMVKAAGFVATTAMPPPEFSPGSQWEFNGPPPSASIINYGQIKVQSGGSLFLIANAIENHGTLTAPDGKVGLYAGKQVLVSDRPDGRGMSVTVTLPSGSVNNDGQIIADGGSILMHAQTVNQDGLLQANSVRQQNGVIELVAGDAVNLGANSVLAARGDNTTVSSGGQITIQSGGSFSDISGSTISVAGGASGGNGGLVEISAPRMPAIHSTIDGRAGPGGIGGRLFLDPADITLGTSDPQDGSLFLNVGTTLDIGGAFFVDSAFHGMSQIDLQATHTITLADGTVWNLAQSTGQSGPGCQLTLETGTDPGSGIIIGNGSSILAGAGWSVALEAGRDFTLPNTFTAAAVASGVGDITFNGNGGLQTQDGSITLIAGNNITVGAGYVRTMNGGSINATAVAGSVNTGTSASGFKFQKPAPGTTSPGYIVDPNLGGISTYAGGDVNITAGQDIISYMPGKDPGANNTEAGSGAFGFQAGNVTLTAGHDVVGHYVVANGTGTIHAGNDAGSTSSNEKLLALSLVSGGWIVKADHDINLQEVRNPNGIFDSINSPKSHFFDYNPNDYVDLNGVNAVNLLGASSPRNSGESSIPSFYPGTLEITAGAGGVTLAKNIVLFPSPVGQLTISTTGGGGLTGTGAGGLTQILMSDSSASQYKNSASFGPNDHAAIPLHLNDPEPVSLNIAGDMNNILLISPKETDINVGGNMNNSRFQIQNLHPTDISKLTVTGDIVNRNVFTTVPDGTAPDGSLFTTVFPPNARDVDGNSLAGKLNLFYLDPQKGLLPLADSGLNNLFSYDSAGQTLTFQGRMTGTQLQELTTLRVEVLNASGGLVVDANGNPVTKSVTFASTAVLNQLFSNSQDVPAAANSGYLVAGPGTLDVNARNMDLGATLGIQSVGPLGNAALGFLGASGAAVNVNLTGNLDMFATTISTEAGGDINVNVQGDANIGSSFFTGNDQLARGIFTASKSDVNVTAGGDINVNGSRIGAYDGGNVTVESLHGDVNAGTGGQGFATVQQVHFDPVTGRVQTFAPQIPGSGIVATTFPPPGSTFPVSHNTVGNILVETPQGNIIANAGGILQLPLNGVSSSAATVTLAAGTKDASGNVIYTGSIDASGSGVIGANVNLRATGDIKGVIIAQNNLNVSANQNVSVTAVAIGNADVSAGGTISGTIVGVGSVNASGSSIDASLLSQNVSASGSTSGSLGFAQANVGSTASTSASATASDQTKTLAANEDSSGTDEKDKRGSAKRSVLTRTGRVTVILPQQS